MSNKFRSLEVITTNKRTDCDTERFVMLRVES